MNSYKVPCDSFGLYPSYAAGILNSEEKIHLYVVCSEQLNYEHYIKKSTAGQDCCISYKAHTGCYFKVSSDGETIAVSSETKIINGRLPSSLIFAQSVLNKIRLSSLAYGIVSINKRLTYFTNKVLTSKHDCMFEVYTCNLDLPKRLAGCKLYIQTCSAYPHKNYSFYTLYCIKKSHRLFGNPQCSCKLCVQDGAASLKSLCINKLGEFVTYPIELKKCKNNCRYIRKLCFLEQSKCVLRKCLFTQFFLNKMLLHLPK